MHKLLHRVLTYTFAQDSMSQLNQRVRYYIALCMLDKSKNNRTVFTFNHFNLVCFNSFMILMYVCTLYITNCITMCAAPVA